MSKAFVRETDVDDDDDVAAPEIPAGSKNYITPAGHRRLKDELLQLLNVERPEVVRVEEVLTAKHTELPPLITVGAHEKVRQAVDTLQRHSISQAPVVREATTDVSQFVGSIRDRELLDRIFRDPDALQADVAEVMGPPIPLVEWSDPLESAFAELENGPAVLVTKAGQVLGVLTRSDLLDFLAHRRLQT